MIKLYWNGIKENGGNLQRCFYSDGKLINYPEGTLTIYGRDYKPFSQGVGAVFSVTNDTDIQTDYIVQDVIRVQPNHPMYAEVKAAHDLAQQHILRRAAKRLDRQAIAA
jgi:hypothetical protein